MSENPIGLPWRRCTRSRYKLRVPPPPLTVMGGNKIVARIGDRRPAFIAWNGDAQAKAVLEVLKSFVSTNAFPVYLWHSEGHLYKWFLENHRTPNSCIAVLTGECLKEGSFTLAGARRGQALTRFPSQRGWVGTLNLQETWYQAIYLARKFTESHKAEGMAEQIASWLR